MADLDLEIGVLDLSLENASGHEHRLRPISDRTLVLLQEALSARLLQGGLDVSTRHFESVRAQPVTLQLASASDEDAARMLADALLGGLLLQLRL
jgi:hypothetical protein